MSSKGVKEIKILFADFRKKKKPKKYFVILKQLLLSFLRLKCSKIR